MKLRERANIYKSLQALKKSCSSSTIWWQKLRSVTQNVSKFSIVVMTFKISLASEDISKESLGNCGVSGVVKCKLRPAV
jgi:hypothetical protein